MLLHLSLKLRVRFLRPSWCGEQEEWKEQDNNQDMGWAHMAPHRGKGRLCQVYYSPCILYLLLLVSDFLAWAFPTTSVRHSFSHELRPTGIILLLIEIVCQ